MFQKYIIIARPPSVVARFVPHSSHPTDWIKPVSLVGIGAGIVTSIILLDFMASRLMPRRPVQVLHFGAPLSPWTPVLLAFPGFSNPAQEFGEGLALIHGESKSILVVDYGTSMNDDEIYQVAIEFLKNRFGSLLELSIYGHSMGGQVGALFRQRYIQEGCPFGEIFRFVMDCSPMRASSLQSPVPPFILRPLMWLLWPGSILRGMIALGHVLSRIFMRPQLDSTADKQLYRRYANAMTLFNPRAWRAQMRYMLRFGKKLRRSNEPTYYICSDRPKRDRLVKQVKAILQWRRKLSNLTTLEADISHAWPLERPSVYMHLFELIWKS